MTSAADTSPVFQDLDPLARAERMQTDGPKPLDVACPRCEAAVGRSCAAASGYPAVTHAARWKAVGVTKPGFDDRHRDYWDQELRRIRKTIEAVPKVDWLRRT